MKYIDGRGANQSIGGNGDLRRPRPAAAAGGWNWTRKSDAEICGDVETDRRWLNIRRYRNASIRIWSEWRARDRRQMAYVDSADNVSSTTTMLNRCSWNRSGLVNLWFSLPRLIIWQADITGKKSYSKKMHYSDLVASLQQCTFCILAVAVYRAYWTHSRHGCLKKERSLNSISSRRSSIMWNIRWVYDEIRVLICRTFPSWIYCKQTKLKN
jgi:hypothetical protein